MRTLRYSTGFVVSTAVFALLTGGSCLVSSETRGAGSPADSIVVSIDDEQLQLLLEEVLERNPTVARLTAEAAAVEQRAPQVKGPPDPVASLTWWLLPPQTRTGPQQVSISVSQRLPWFGTLKVAEQAAMWDAASARARLDSGRLEVVTEARVAYLEMQYLDAERRVLADDVATLEHYAELALARYASGVGLNQSVIKLDAEITRSRARLLGVGERRAALAARLNSMRDRPHATPVAVGAPGPAGKNLVLDPLALRQRALANRPEMAAAAAAVESASTRTLLAQKGSSPDIFFGLNYGFVGRREDAAGRFNPPEDNGDDTLGLSAGVSLPVWRSKIDAEVEESVQLVLAAEEAERETAVAIDRELGDLTNRIPLLREQLALYDDVLVRQAEASLESAESAYAAGTAGALDLLDAERILLQVRIAAERTRTDLAVALARLEGAIAGPLEVTP
jgi:outer membrane protein TolC